jgi:hypothetical protein
MSILEIRIPIFSWWGGGGSGPGGDVGVEVGGGDQGC